ncbi:MAG: mercury resistance system transport protein MerF [Burkholderiales bacterium]|nr:mercury resistance system transport protein MerF [Burkholderiales bacterium]
MPKDSTLLKLGVGGTILVALCCFTPILVILIGVVGLGALTGYLDYVLLPALAIFIGITIYALQKRRRGEASCTTGNGVEKQ